jgi:hypothetical protein
VKRKDESEARNYEEERALYEEVKALREAKEEAGTHHGESGAQIDEIKSMKIENEPEARDNAEELATLRDKIRTLREAKKSEHDNDHRELAARVEEIMKKILEALLIIVNTDTDPESQLGTGPLTESLVVAQEQVKCGFMAFFLHNCTRAIAMEWLLHFFHKIGRTSPSFKSAMVLM